MDVVTRYCCWRDLVAWFAFNGEKVPRGLVSCGWSVRLTCHTWTSRLFHNSLAQPWRQGCVGELWNNLLAVKAVQGDCQWPLKTLEIFTGHIATYVWPTYRSTTKKDDATQFNAMSHATLTTDDPVRNQFILYMFFMNRQILQMYLVTCRIVSSHWKSCIGNILYQTPFYHACFNIALTFPCAIYKNDGLIIEIESCRLLQITTKCYYIM